MRVYPLKCHLGSGWESDPDPLALEPCVLPMHRSTSTNIIFNYLCNIGTNQNTGVKGSLHSQRRDWTDKGEIKYKNWSSKMSPNIDGGVEEKQKLFDWWRNESY